MLYCFHYNDAFAKPTSKEPKDFQARLICWTASKVTSVHVLCTPHVLVEVLPNDIERLFEKAKKHSLEAIQQETKHKRAQIWGE